jgi:hypothetical protein
MTFEELDARYANGFSDARLLRIEVDYAARTAEIRFSMRLAMPDSSDAAEYSLTRLRLENLHYLVIEAPDEASRLQHLGKPITVDGLPEDGEKFPLFTELGAKEEAFCCRLFVHDWNSFIHVAAATAGFTEG